MIYLFISALEVANMIEVLKFWIISNGRQTVEIYTVLGIVYREVYDKLHSLAVDLNLL